MSTSTPGEESYNLEGNPVTLCYEEQKGEPESDVFQIVKFQKEKPDSLSLADVVLHVQLFNAKYESFFKATFDDPTKVVRDHKVPMVVVIDTLQEILAGKADNVVLEYEKVDEKQVLKIMKTVEYKMFSSVVVFKFCYKFQKAKMSLEDKMNMKLGALEQKINERRIEELDDDINNQKLFITGKKVDDAKFDASRNNHNTVQNNGKTLARTGGSTAWNTTPLTTLMSTTQSYRMRFRVACMNCSNIMFGVVSSSFSNHTGYPQGNGYYGWVAYCSTYTITSSYAQNGSFTTSSICVTGGSIITVEYHPKHGMIHYFVNNTPAAKHYGCSFNNGNARFAVTLYRATDKVELLSLEQIEDTF